MYKEAIVWVMAIFFVGCLLILGWGMENGRIETLEAIAELKAEVQALQAALEVHNAKPYWWEADNGDTSVQDRLTG